MDMTITLGQACMLIIVFLVVLLLLALISAVRNLIPSIKTLAHVMEHVETITASAANSSQQAENVIADAMQITATVLATVKSQTSLLGQISSIGLAIKAISEFIAKRQKKSHERADEDIIETILEQEREKDDN